MLQVYCVLPAPVPYAYVIWQCLITHEQRCCISDAQTAPAQPACVCVRVFHNLTTDAFQVSERLCVCHHTLYLYVIAVSNFLLLIHRSSLPHFAKAIPAMEIAIRPAER